MNAQTILRINKLKSLRDLEIAASHDTRSFVTPNASPDKNVVILTGPTTTVEVVKLTREKIGSQKIRKNAVLGAEIILSASPEYFRPDNPASYSQWDEHKLNLWQKVSNNWLEKILGNNIVQTSLHLDEATPHLHCLWVPLNKAGKLSYKTTEFGGTRDNLSKIQDSYAQALEPLGIERGVKGSKTTHTKIKQYYQAVNTAIQEPLVTEQLFPEAKDKETATQYRKRAIQQAEPHWELIKLQLAQIQMLQKERDTYRQKAMAAEKQRQAFSEKANLALDLTTGLLKTLIPLATTITSLSPNGRVDGKEWSFSRKTEVIFVHRHSDNFKMSLNPSNLIQVATKLKPQEIKGLQDLSILMGRWLEAKYSLYKNTEQNSL